VLHLERDRDPVGRGVGAARGRRQAPRGGGGPPFAFEVVDTPDGVRVKYRSETPLERPQPPRAEARVLEALRARPEPAALDALMAATGLERGTVKNALTALRQQGLARPVARGRWEATSSSLGVSDDDARRGDDSLPPHG
jgi:hypothetical protein